MRWMVIDGIDATGKSTLCRSLVKYYEAKNMRTSVCGEFSSNFIGRGISEIVSQRRFFALDESRGAPISELLVIIADTFGKYELDAQSECDIVIMERGILSAIGYQLVRLQQKIPETKDGGFPDHLLQLVAAASKYAAWPDCHFTLTISEEELVRRIAGRGESQLDRARLTELMDAQKHMQAIGLWFRAIDLAVDGKEVEEVVERIVENFDRRTEGRL